MTKFDKTIFLVLILCLTGIAAWSLWLQHNQRPGISFPLIKKEEAK